MKRRQVSDRSGLFWTGGYWRRPTADDIRTDENRPIVYAELNRVLANVSS